MNKRTKKLSFKLKIDLFFRSIFDFNTHWINWGEKTTSTLMIISKKKYSWKTKREKTEKNPKSVCMCWQVDFKLTTEPYTNRGRENCRLQKSSSFFGSENENGDNVFLDIAGEREGERRVFFQLFSPVIIAVLLQVFHTLYVVQYRFPVIYF